VASYSRGDITIRSDCPTSRNIPPYQLSISPIIGLVPPPGPSDVPSSGQPITIPNGLLTPSVCDTGVNSCGVPSLYAFLTSVALSPLPRPVVNFGPLVSPQMPDVVHWPPRGVGRGLNGSGLAGFSQLWRISDNSITSSSNRVARPSVPACIFRCSCLRAWLDSRNRNGLEHPTMWNNRPESRLLIRMLYRFSLDQIVSILPPETNVIPTASRRKYRRHFAR